MSASIFDSGGPAPEVALGQDAQPAENPTMRAIGDDYMTTAEAAAYLRRHKTFILSQPDLPYLKGHPNTYAKRDLDDWFERHKTKPRMR